MSVEKKETLTDPTGRVSLDEKHAPVPLPATSYDIEVLTKGLNASVSGAAGKREETRVAAIENAAADKARLVPIDPAAQEGFAIVKTENAELGVEEQLRVYKPGSEAATSATTDAPVEKEK